ncbi:MAG: hypothetical protein K2H44_03810, partial [Muribaculaceae bacterium]|nr:hypothetical protein [Muribaculaceae bacterium]
GEAKISRVELTFWHTFPRLTLDVDSVELISHSLKSAPDSLSQKLPNDADSLLSIGCFHGGVNIADLMIGRITLYDVIIERAKVNLVVADASHNNFDIFKSDTEEKEDSTSTIPQFSIDRFAIIDAAPLKFRSLPDSLDLAINIETVDLKGKEAPDYRLSFKGTGETPMLDLVNLDSIAVAVDGSVKWTPDKPNAIELNNFNLKIDSISSQFSTVIDMADSMIIKSLDFKLNQLPLSYIVKRVPDMDPKLISTLDSDMKINLTGSMFEPYTVGDTVNMIPSIKGNFEIPKCKFYFAGLKFDRFNTNIDYLVDGKNLDNSTVDVKEFIIDGRVMDVDMKATIKNIMSDPYVDGKIKARFDINRLPRQAWNKFFASLGGKLSADLAIKAHQSYLSPNKFHKMKITGDIDLDNFHLISLDSVTSAGLDHSCLQFGTNKKFVTDSRPMVDSLLTISLTADSVNFISGPITALIKGFKGGVGTRITPGRKDPKTVMPFGGVLSFKSIRLDDRTDSLRLKLTDIDCRASLTRFNNNAKAPQLSLVFDAKRITGAKKHDIASFSGNHFDVTMHLKEIRQRRIRTSNDSTRVLRQRHEQAKTSEDDLDLEVDSGLKVLLNKWDIHGTVTSRNGRFRMAAIPVSNRVKNIDFRFNTDSLILKNLYYKMGNSDFTISGTVSNLRRALTRKRNNTIKIDFKVTSDTINVNKISQLLITDVVVSDDENSSLSDFDDTPDYSLSDSTVTHAFVVPSNLNATLRVRAKNVIYTDLLLHNFKGSVLIADNAVNLHRISASTDIGSVDISALYSAPNKKDIDFGVGMKIENFHIAKFIDMMPAIDTLMPLLKDFSGIINADIAATSKVDSLMNIDIPSLQAAIKLSGDSLVLLDADTFKSLSKWLMFKNKKRNMIDSMNVEIVVENSNIEIFPFLFNIDRYRLGVMGTNDLNMNLDYHISVLKSPLPFKFGINIKGPVDDFKIRLGGAKFKNETAARMVAIADTTRINLVNQIENVFRRSARASAPLRLNRPKQTVNTAYEELTPADSAMLIKEGLIQAPDSINLPSK